MLLIFLNSKFHIKQRWRWPLHATWKHWGKNYYSYAHFDIQHWIEVSAKCDLPAALTPPHHPAIYICWQGGSEDHIICLETLEERKILSSKRVLNCDRLSISTEVAIPTELYGMPHVSLLFMLILCLRLYPQFVLCTNCYVLLAGSGATALQRDVMWVA